MTAERSVYRRALRRETHSSRAGAAIAVAVCLILALAAAGAACVSLVVDPSAAAALHAGFAEAPAFAPAVRYPVLFGGCVGIVLGLAVLLLGMLPGRRARRVLGSDRAAIVVDDRVIANALAARAARAAGTETRQLDVRIGRRRAAVRVVPSSGVAVDVAAVREAAVRDAAVYGLIREPRITVAESGEVGR